MFNMEGAVMLISERTMKSFALGGCLSLLLWVAATIGAMASDKTTVRLGGDLGQTGLARVSIAQIEALGLVEVEVFNPDERRVANYQGVWLSDFVAAFGTGDTRSVEMTAIDFYQASFQQQEWLGLRILLATQEDGRHLEVDRKGPMRVIFADYNAEERVYQETIGKWIWMINKIDFSD